MGMLFAMQLKANKTSKNLPPPPQGDNTCAIKPPVDPSVPKAAMYSGFVIVTNAAPRIEVKQMGI